MANVFSYLTTFHGDAILLVSLAYQKGIEMDRMTLELGRGAGGSVRMSREDRMDQIFSIVERAHARVSIGYIAQRTGLKKTPYLQDMLAEMCKYHYLEREKMTLTNGAQAWIYDIPQEMKDGE